MVDEQVKIGFRDESALVSLLNRLTHPVMRSSGQVRKEVREPPIVLHHIGMVEKVSKLSILSHHLEQLVDEILDRLHATHLLEQCLCLSHYRHHFFGSSTFLSDYTVPESLKESDHFLEPVYFK